MSMNSRSLLAAMGVDDATVATLVGSSSTSVPACSAGDLIVVVALAAGQGGTQPVPAGYTSMGIVEASNYFSHAAIKVADGTEGGTAPLVLVGNSASHAYFVFEKDGPASTTLTVTDLEATYTGAAGVRSQTINCTSAPAGGVAWIAIMATDSADSFLPQDTYSGDSPDFVAQQASSTHNYAIAVGVQVGASRSDVTFGLNALEFTYISTAVLQFA